MSAVCAAPLYVLLPNVGTSTAFLAIVQVNVLFAVSPSDHTRLAVLPREAVTVYVPASVAVSAPLARSADAPPEIVRVTGVSIASPAEGAQPASEAFCALPLYV